MARHKKMESMEDAETTMDISPLIDCCFLLLLYFLVATTIAREQKLDMAMPGMPPPSQEKKTMEQQLVVIDENQAVLYGQAGSSDMVTIEASPDVHSLPGLVTELLNFKERSESVGSEPIVQFRVEGSVPQQRVIDVLNAFAEAGIDKVAMVNVQDEED